MNSKLPRKLTANAPILSGLQAFPVFTKGSPLPQGLGVWVSLTSADTDLTLWGPFQVSWFPWSQGRDSRCLSLSSRLERGAQGRRKAPVGLSRYQGGHGALDSNITRSLTSISNVTKPRQARSARSVHGSRHHTAWVGQQQAGGCVGSGQRPPVGAGQEKLCQHCPVLCASQRGYAKLPPPIPPRTRQLPRPTSGWNCCSVRVWQYWQLSPFSHLPGSPHSSPCLTFGHGDDLTQQVG